jgi:hypothetical protein
MQTRKQLTLAIFALLAAGCGSSSDSGSGGSSGSSGGSGTFYAFLPPASGVTRIFAESIVDNAGNTIDIGFSDTVTVVNSDGSYTALEQSTTGDSTIVNGTNYAVTTETGNYNDSGQEISYSFTGETGALVTCTYAPHANGPDFPVQVGQTWQIAYTGSCDNGSASVSYTQQGIVVDVESITVPAGTFTALKLQSTVTWADAGGTTRIQTIINWRDTATLYSLKQRISIAVSGNLPTTGYPVSRSIELQSISPAH